MRAFNGLTVVFGLALALAGCKQQEANPSSNAIAPNQADKPVQIPGIRTPPAGTSDWLKQAYQVQVLTPLDGHMDSKAELTLAWTPTALLLHVHSNDTTPVETAINTWNDSIEIFLASSPGSDDRLHFIFSPGRSAKPLSPAFHIDDKRKDARPPVAPEISTIKDDTGYNTTISIPWANLKSIPQPGQSIALQVYVNDAQSNGQVSRRIWFPEMIAGDEWTSMRQVQLVGQADAPETATAWLQPMGFDEILHVTALVGDVGKKIEVWSSGKLVASGQLASGGSDGSSVELPLSGEWTQQKDAPVLVTVDGSPLHGILKMPDLRKRRQDSIEKLPLVANPCIFDTPIFPKIDFRNREVVEAASGPYTLKTRFFDANWNEVTVPKEPGRYGAVVEFHGEKGLTFTHYLTLYKTPHPYSPMNDPYDVTVKFPAAFGLSPDVLAKEQWNVDDATGRTLQDLPRYEPDWAVLMASLHDLTTDPAKWHGFTAWTIDDIWWTELRKRLGENQDYLHVMQLPDGYDKDSHAWPLILFLHGSGERGTDLSVLKTRGPLGYINAGHPLPFIIVEALCPEHEWWDPSRLARLIDQVSATNRVDPKRIYVTGLSMGGYGSFDLAASYPDKIAAIAPLSGGASPEIAARLKKMPTWIFHGDSDSVVPCHYSVDVFHAMQKVGAPVKLTVYPGIGHWGWQTTYSDPALYAWFLQQHSK